MRMQRSKKTILVTGITGRQGGAVADVLFALGWQVRGLTRNRQGQTACKLADKGIEIVEGNLADRKSVDQAMQGVYGVFSVHPGSLSKDQDEVCAGIHIAESAKAHKVVHLVYSSANSVEQADETGMQKEKWEIEQYIRTLGISATIVRPTSFMENFLNPHFGVKDNTFSTAALPSTRLQLIALQDIGIVTEMAFRQPELYCKSTIELAGDALTPLQIVDSIGRATGRTIHYKQLSLETLHQLNPQYARGYEFLNSGRVTQANSEDLRKLHPGLMTFDTWLKHISATKMDQLLGLR